jgi:hypothetical protein
MAKAIAGAQPGVDVRAEFRRLLRARIAATTWLPTAKRDLAAFRKELAAECTDAGHGTLGYLFLTESALSKDIATLITATPERVQRQFTVLLLWMWILKPRPTRSSYGDRQTRSTLAFRLLACPRIAEYCTEFWDFASAPRCRAFMREVFGGESVDTMSALIKQATDNLPETRASEGWCLQLAKGLPGIPGAYFRQAATKLSMKIQRRVAGEPDAVVAVEEDCRARRVASEIAAARDEEEDRRRPDPLPCCGCFGWR